MSKYFDIISSRNNWDKNQKDNIYLNSEKIFKKIEKFTLLKSSSVGLVVGKVQSGKTANIIGLSAHSFDRNVKMIVVFLSDQNPLYKQNIKRISSSFDELDDFVIIDNSINGNITNFNKTNLNNFYEDNKKLIVCSLKHHKRIDDLISLVSSTKYSADLSIIIDDEGDDVSQNTKKGKYKLDPERSSTNKSLVSLKNSLISNCYLSVTATPQASILLQKYQDLAPSFANLIFPGDDYTGLNYFHDESNSHLLEEIKDYDKFIEKNSTPESFYRAIAYYLIGAYERKSIEKNNFKHSMMIHSAKEIIKQGNIFNKVDTLMQVLSSSIKEKSINNNSYTAAFYSIFKIVFDQEKIRLGIKYNVEDYFKLVLPIINQVKLILLNGQQEVDSLNEKIKYFNYFIVIGGDMLDRGLTIDGLAVSYFTRETKSGKSQADTMMQRARWFGYKKNYIKYCKLYTTENNLRIYENLISHEDSVWDSISLMQGIDVDLRKADITFKIDTEILNPTSQSKAKWEKGFETWSVQTNFSKNLEHHLKNEKLINNLFATNYKEVLMTKNNVHKKKLLNAEETLKFLKEFNYSDLDSAQERTFTKLENFLAASKLKETVQVEVILMRFKTGEERSLIISEEDNSAKLSNLMQGRNEEYRGDRYFIEDNIQLQIHIVKLKDNYKHLRKGDTVYALALGIPEKLFIDKVVRSVIVDQK
jgi:hypothetical protein